MSRNNNGIVLSFGDYVIRSSDISILQSNAWLNDTLIGFFFEFLSSKRFPECKGFKFFGPEVTQCIKLGSTEDLPVFLGNSDSLSKIDFMFWPVNDSTDPHNHCGGSHWSLLVFSRRENVFAHYDSTMVDGGGNHKQAKWLYEKLAPFISRNADYRNMPCESQRNGYDCGIYVLCNAELLAEAAASTGRILRAITATSHLVSNMRDRLTKIIHVLGQSNNSSL